MIPEPGAVYRVDLGIAGKVRPFIVVSRRDDNPPRALALCVPITTRNRESDYEVPLPRVRFLREQSYANVQGLQAIQFQEMEGPVGRFTAPTLDAIRDALRYAMEL
jgi:mRNA-degrading endonuclease toxin of MazEF toxin-antitoxin module